MFQMYRDDVLLVFKGDHFILGSAQGLLQSFTVSLKWSFWNEFGNEQHQAEHLIIVVWLVHANLY